MSFLHKGFIFLFASAWIMLGESFLFGNTYYVATWGSDTYNGTFDQPWASWQKAFDRVSPGDTVFIHGGTYGIPSSHLVETAGAYAGFKEGTPAEYITIMNYPGELPVLDCYTTSREISDGIYLQNVKYWHLMGLTIVNALQKTDGSTMASGFQFKDCDYIKVENCITHNIQGAGFKSLNGIGHYTFINCDSYNNYDPFTGYPNIPGGNADGFCAYDHDDGSEISYLGCRAWGNSDDGFDTYWTDGLVTFDECWSFGNGYSGGNGFKLGPLHRTISYNTERIVRNCIASHNKVVGFAQNFLGLKLELYNNSSYHNGNDGFDMEAGIYSKILRNNLAYKNGVLDGHMGINDIHDHNSWDASVIIDESDFLSLDTMQLYRARNMDGSLPDIDFLKLAFGSDLIDAGFDVGLNYTGAAPDIGAFESDDATHASAPVFQNASINNDDPTIVVLSYDLDLVNTIVPSTGSFAVRVNSVINPVYYVTISGRNVYLSITNPVAFGDVISVTYLQPSANPMQTAEGGLAETFMQEPVTNNIHKTIPDFIAAVVENTAPSSVKMTYDLTLANAVPAASSFTVMVNTESRTISSVSVSGKDVILILNSPVVHDDVITIAYIRPDENPLQSSLGGQAENLGTTPVTNNVAALLPVYMGSVIENSTPSQLAMTFSTNLANVVPSSTAFIVKVNSLDRMVSAVSVSGTRVTLTLNIPVIYGDVVTVTYSKPASNPLQSTTGAQTESFSVKPVTNRVALIIPTLVGSAIENATPSALEMNYSLALANIVPTTNTFSVQINAETETVNSVTVSGTKVILNLSSPVFFGDVITLSYNKPANNYLQTPNGGAVVSFTTQPVTNRVTTVNPPPVVIINADNTTFSGFEGEADATASYDQNHDNLSFEWTIPESIPVSAVNAPKLQFLSPVVNETKTYEFTLKISDGNSIQTKSIPVNVLPYKPGLKIAKVLRLEASDSIPTGSPHNVADGSLKTIWSANGDNNWITLHLSEAFKIQYIMLAFHPDLKKEAYFDIHCSTNNVTWEQVLVNSASCSFSGNLQVFDFPGSMAGKEFSFVKLIGHGNSSDFWNYISEFRVFGYSTGKINDINDAIILIYPNPATSFINLAIWGEYEVKPDYMRIMNPSGVIVYENRLNPEINEVQIPLALDKGTYLVQLRSANLRWYQQKLIIQ